MPLIKHSTYRAPWWLPGAHLQTIAPALLRKAHPITTERERLELGDGDFLDLDWRREGRSKLAILSHGLEGSTKANYIQSMADALWQEGWDVLAWNFRSCSGEMNRLARFYHSGASEDLKQVINHTLAQHPAEQIDLVGFSLGGNLTLKLLGEMGNNLSPRIHRAITFSVPCDLACSSLQLESWLNQQLYMPRFIRPLLHKIATKRSSHPEIPEIDPNLKIKSFREFDDRYTAPLHGFLNAEDYWERSSSRPWLSSIRIPTLLVQATNDPFLAEKCYPYTEANESDTFFLEVTQGGGHVGFGSPWQKRNWAESRAIEFAGDQ